MDSSNTVITKETKNRIQVDYEGKLSFKERLMKKLQSSHTWIKVVVSILKFILMLGVSYVILFPFFAKIAGSFMSKTDIVDPTVSLIPKNFTFEIYTSIIKDMKYIEAFFNTLLLSLLCAIVQTFIACLVGYGIAKFKFKLNKFVMLAVVITMLIPHATLRGAMYWRFSNFDITVRAFGDAGIFHAIFGQLDLINTFWPLLILSIGGLAFKNGLYIYMMRQFFKGVPDELEESAYVDGSGTFRTFIQIILPLSIPMMITIFLFAFSWQWTDQFYTTTFFTDAKGDVVRLMPDLINADMATLAIWDDKFAGKELYRQVIVNSAGIMIILPLVIMYLFCQKYLVQGIERSGLVG